jgi:hypothetical protein
VTDLVRVYPQNQRYLRAIKILQQELSEPSLHRFEPYLQFLSPDKNQHTY